MSPAEKKASRATKAPKRAPEPAPDGFMLPSMDLLCSTDPAERAQENEEELRETASCLQETLEDFKIMAQVVGWVAGPTVTLFKVDLPAGVRVSRVTALEADIALALAAPGVRIFAPIPGTNYVGIEVPNRSRRTVFLGDVLSDAPDGPCRSRSARTSRATISSPTSPRCPISSSAAPPDPASRSPSTR